MKNNNMYKIKKSHDIVKKIIIVGVEVKCILIFTETSLHGIMQKM